MGTIRKMTIEFYFLEGCLCSLICLILYRFPGNVEKSNQRFDYNYGYFGAFFYQL